MNIDRQAQRLVAPRHIRLSVRGTYPAAEQRLGGVVDVKSSNAPSINLGDGSVGSLQTIVHSKIEHQDSPVIRRQNLVARPTQADNN